MKLWPADLSCPLAPFVLPWTWSMRSLATFCAGCFSTSLKDSGPSHGPFMHFELLCPSRIWHHTQFTTLSCSSYRWKCHYLHTFFWENLQSPWHFWIPLTKFRFFPSVSSITISAGDLYVNSTSSIFPSCSSVNSCFRFRLLGLGSTWSNPAFDTWVYH